LLVEVSIGKRIKKLKKKKKIKQFVLIVSLKQLHSKSISYASVFYDLLYVLFPVKFCLLKLIIYFCIFRHLDNHSLWEGKAFAVRCFKIIMYSIQVDTNSFAEIWS